MNNDSVEWDGITYSYANDSTLYKAIVDLNRAKDAWDDSDALLSVATHEFGHALGLGDLDSYNECIMNGYTWGDGSRYGDYGITSPQDDDIDGVNSIYGY